MSAKTVIEMQTAPFRKAWECPGSREEGEHAGIKLVIAAAAVVIVLSMLV